MRKSETIKMSPKISKLVSKLLASGGYRDADDVIHAGLSRLADEVENTAKIKEMLQIAIDQSDRGEFVEYTAEDIKREGRRLLRLRKKAS